jgi:hypothetical protein
MKVARIFFYTAFLTAAPVALSASCSSSPSAPAGPGADGGSDAANEAGGSTSDGTGGDAPGADACPSLPDAGDPCSGSDKSFIFAGAVAPNPSPADAAADGDAALDADAATDASVPLSIFTPAACRAVLAAEAAGLVAQGPSTMAPSWVAPANGDALPSSEWFTFEWMKGPDARRDVLRRALEWIEPSARAAGPTSGDAYVVEFRDSCSEILRVMVEDTVWTVDPYAWATLLNVNGPITATVTWVKFANDAIAPGTSPVVSAPVTFTFSND